MSSIPEEVAEVLERNRRDRDWFLHYRARWLREQGIIEVRPADDRPTRS